MWYSIQTLLFCNIYMHRLYIIKSISPKAPTKQILGSSRIIWLARRYRRALVLSRDTEDPSQWEADLKVHSVAVVAGRQHSQSVSSLEPFSSLRWNGSLLNCPTKRKQLSPLSPNQLRFCTTPLVPQVRLLTLRLVGSLCPDTHMQC